MKLRSATGKAPGRLDVLGGVADYSGALVLETPIRAQTSVRVTEIDDEQLHFRSRGNGEWAGPLDRLKEDLTRPPKEVRERLDAFGVPSWARYSYGCLWALCRAKGVTPRTGMKLSVTQSVPTCVGVSSSAALEIATLRALAQVMKCRFDGTELARLGQQAENQIVGAPCGLMDQLTCAYGRPGKLLPIRCQPDQLQKLIDLPRGVAVVGWSSNVRHSVAESPYATARAATFMGKRMLEELWRRKIPYAADISPSLLSRWEAEIPESITGRTFARRFGSTDDPLSTVRARQSYPVRAALRFASLEDRRSRLAAALLRAQGPGLDDRLEEVGELMYQSHEGYRAIGLGHERTDEMVDAIRALGPEEGFYGARSSGGGSGGTVAILMRKSTIPTLRRLASPGDLIPAVA